MELFGESPCARHPGRRRNSFTAKTVPVPGAIRGWRSAGNRATPLGSTPGSAGDVSERRPSNRQPSEAHLAGAPPSHTWRGPSLFGARCVWRHSPHAAQSSVLARALPGRTLLVRPSDTGIWPVIVTNVDISQPDESPELWTARLLRWQAKACRELGSPLYGDLLTHAADDLAAGGPTAGVLRGHLSDRLSSVIALRLLGGVHALALSGRAPDLAAFYPSCGGTAESEPGSPRACVALRGVLAEQGETVRGWLGRPPQTNEVGRAAALLGALRHVAAEASLPIRLAEVGASAGLNLRADHFFVSGPAGRHGSPDSPVALTDGWLGAPLPLSRIEVVERTGGDLAPIDPLTDQGRLTLTAYVWPDQADRLCRLRGAFEVARHVPADLRAEPASATVARLKLEPGSWTVLWHSIFRQYLSDLQRDELAAGVTALGASATGNERFAYVYLEQSRAGGCPVTLTTWPGGYRRVLGTAPAHGLPVRWHAQPH